MTDIHHELAILPCMCASFRRASRTLTQLYDEALRPVGLRATQFTILQALFLAGEVSQGGLAQILAMDSTTLTRTLRIMAGRGGSESAVARTGENGCCGWRKLADINSTARFLPGKRRKHSWGDSWETSAGTP